MDCYQWVGVGISTVILIAAVLLAWGAWGSAGAAKSTEKVVKSQAILQLLGEFSPIEMRGHIGELKGALQDDEEKREMIRKYEEAWRTGNFEEIPRRVENARRSLAWYFTKIHVLYKIGALTKDDIKEFVKEHQVEIYDFVELLDDPCRLKDVGDFFRSLYLRQEKEEGGKVEE